MTPDTESGGFDAKQARLENPSGWVKLTHYETVRLLIDALLESPPNHHFNKSELERRTGLSREAIRQHLPFLIELGVVEEVHNESWTEYRLNDDGKVTKELFELSSAVNSVLSGEPKNVQDEPRVTLDDLPDKENEPDRGFIGSPDQVDNSRREIADDDLIDQPPGHIGAINAD